MQDEDRQTQEAFEDYSAMSGIPEDRINRTPLSADQRRELLRDSAKFVAEMTPVVGDVMSAREVWEELQKDEPNYLLVGALAGATAIGLIPGIGDAAAQAIRTGARKGLDFARRVEVDPNALGSTGGNIRLRPEDQVTPTRNLNIASPTPLNSLEELLNYNSRVRQPRSLLDRDTVRPGDNILYRPDRGYRAIGPEGYQDFLESGVVRAVSGSKQGYETPYFMRGQSSSRYVRPEGEDYIVETPLDTSWRGAATADDKYVGPGSNESIKKDSPIRVFRRNEDGSYSVVFDNIGDEALLPSNTPGFSRGGLVDEDVTLEAVPGFQRPMSANPNDRVVGEDELGRRVYETATGQRYTLSANPDQRTTRTRVEEDFLPAMQEYLQNPTMPTASQAAGFVGDVARGAFESLEGAVKGRGTLGDVTGLAVGSGAGSMFGEVPEGALRIFGGFRAARDPGVDASGNLLPRSVGADELERFEIDDSQASFNPTRVPQQNMSSLDNRADRARIAQNPEQYFARLDQVLDHSELFRQYPDLGGLRVVEDTSIDPRTGGYYDPTQNLLAVSPNTMKDLDFFRRVIVHEVQHAVQEMEGFDRGTNTQAPEVTERSKADIEEARKLQDQASQRFKDFDFESKLDEVRDFIQPLLNDIDAEGFVTTDEIFFTSPHRAGWTQSLEDLATTLEDQNLQGFDAYDTLLDFYAFVRENPQLIPEESLEDFAEAFKISVDELSNLRTPFFIDTFEEFGIIPIDPQRFSFLEGDIRERAYVSRSGEVEATNVMDRLGYSLAQRFSQPPEQTEKIMRAEQWRVDPTGQIVDSAGKQFNTGGMVSMEEQMSLFEMGGLADDGSMRDPVSGNEVPPGSLASEVRDDVPAMLSEGEYIVPADVVRFFGVKFFEDLRSQAKSGLMDMERGGRIGGEPIDATPGDEPLTPEELAMLTEISGMAKGGMVRQGYQVGGMVAPVTQQDFLGQAQQAQNFTLPSSVFAPPAPTPQAAAPFTPVTLYGPANEVMLATSQDQYNMFISQGYTTQPKPVQATLEPTGGDNRTEESEVSGGGGFSLNDENLEAMRSNPLSFGAESLKSELPFSSRQIAGAGSLVGGMPGMIAGGLAGAAFELDNIAKARASLEVARAQGQEGTAEFVALNNDINKAVENLSGPARLLERLGLGSGKSYETQALATTATAAPAPRTPPTPARPVATPPVATPASVSDAGLSRAASMTEAEKTAAREYAERGSDRDTSWEGGQVGFTAADKEKSDRVASGSPAAGKDFGGRDISSDKFSGKGYTSGRAKGGLVTRPERKKSVVKKK